MNDGSILTMYIIMCWSHSLVPRLFLVEERGNEPGDEAISCTLWNFDLFLDAHQYIFRQLRLRSGKTALFGTEILKEGVGSTSQLEQIGVLRVQKSRVHEVDG